MPQQQKKKKLEKKKEICTKITVNTIKKNVKCNTTAKTFDAPITTLLTGYKGSARHSINATFEEDDIFIYIHIHRGGGSFFTPISRH